MPPLTTYLIPEGDLGFLKKLNTNKGVRSVGKSLLSDLCLKAGFLLYTIMKDWRPSLKTQDSYNQIQTYFPRNTSILSKSFLFAYGGYSIPSQFRSITKEANFKYYWGNALPSFSHLFSFLFFPSSFLFHFLFLLASPSPLSIFLLLPILT